MNIGIDIRSLMDKNRTGVGEYTYEFLQALFQIDKENQYFLFYNSFKDVSSVVPAWKQKNVHYVVTRWPNKLFNLCQLILRWPKLDNVVYSQKPKAKSLDYWFSPNLNFTALSKRTKFVLTIHDLSFEFFPECFSWKKRLWHKILQPGKQCRRACLVLTPSENTKQDVVGYYKVKGDKVRVLYPGLSENFLVNNLESVDNVREKYNLPDKFILCLGTLQPRKNIITLIEAYKKSSLITDQCSLIIAGARGWKDKKILKAIENTKGVYYVGYVKSQDKPALYSTADLFVYPSLYEGFGFPVLEAMFSGVPVITSNRSSLPEVGGDAVYLVNPYNLSELKKAIEILLRKQKLRDILKSRGVERAKKFSWNKSAHDFLNNIEIKK